MINPKIFIGPMSLNVVDSVIEYCNDNNVTMGLIPSRRQVEFNGGYVNNWNTKDFSKYVKTKTDKVLLVRDHGGPNQGNNPDDGLESLKEDCKYLDFIHIDVWKSVSEIEEGVKKTVELIDYCYKLNPKIFYEIGTEQSIRPFNHLELDFLINEVKNRLGGDKADRIKYAVIQSGTALEGNTNTGDYNKKRLIDMISVVKKHGLISKEHNGDYLPTELIKEKFSLGLDSINIAPEFGQIETKIILDYIKKEDISLMEEFYKICYNSKKWVKWVNKDFNPEKNKEKIINICGHYTFSYPKFLKLKEKLTLTDVEIKEKIKNKINDISF